MTTTDISAIAAGLTETMMKALLKSSEGCIPGWTRKNTIYGLANRKLINYPDYYGHQLTPLGEAVRKVLPEGSG